MGLGGKHLDPVKIQEARMEKEKQQLLWCWKRKQFLGFNVGRMNNQKYRAVQNEQGEW